MLNKRPLVLLKDSGWMLLRSVWQGCFVGLLVAASAKSDDVAAKTYSQKAPNGTTVELIALRKMTNAGDVWWSPDGKVIEKLNVPFDEEKNPPPKDLVGVLYRWSTEPEPKRYRLNVFGEVIGADAKQARGEESTDGTGIWIEYVKPRNGDTVKVEIKVTEHVPELAYGSPGDEISWAKVVFEDVSVVAGKQSEVKVRVDDSENTLAMKMRRAAAEFFGGHMLVEFERQVDASIYSGKTEPDWRKSSGRIGWQSDGELWRIDYASRTLATNSQAAQEEVWSSGYDGEQLFQWVRNRNQLIIGSVVDHCRQHEPQNLFWKSTSGLDGMLKAISRKTAKTTAATLNGFEGLRIESVSENDPKWSWSAFVCPSRGYLPLEVHLSYEGRVTWESKFSELKEVQARVWAPTKIHVTSYVWPDGKQRMDSNIEFVVKEIEVDPEAVGWQMQLGGRSNGFGSSHPRDPRDDPSPFQHDFTKQGIDLGNAPKHLKFPRYGTDVVDLVRGVAYHNDPWWSDLEPILKAKLDWPRPSLVALDRMASHLREPPSDQPLKSLPGLPLMVEEDDDCRCDDFDWLTKSKLDWKQLDGKVTLFVFWNCWDADSVAAFAALNRLHETYEPSGLMILAVHRPRQADYARHMVDVFKPQFPVVIDAENESGEGLLRETLKVRGSPAAVFVDHQRIVRTIADGAALTKQIGELLAAAGTKDVPVLDQHERLHDAIGEGAKSAWLALIAKTPKTSRIRGQVVDRDGKPIADAELSLKLQLKLLDSPIGSYMVYPDPAGNRTLKTNAEGKFDFGEILKGGYSLKVHAQNWAMLDQEFALAEKETRELKLVLAQAQGHGVGNDFGSVRGQVRIEGRIPKLPPVPVYDRNLNYPWRRKDPTPAEEAAYEAERAKNPAKFDPRKARDESLLISDNGGLANVFVYLQKAPAGWQPTPAPTKPAILQTQEDRFAPRALLVRIGQPLTLSAIGCREVDNFHSEPLRNMPFNISVAPETTQSVPTSCLTKSEKLPSSVHSGIHPRKRASILVLDHPFAAITDTEGRFEIKGLPPGTHSLTVWNERVGYFEKALPVTVKVDEPTPPLELNYPAEKLKVYQEHDSYKKALGQSRLGLIAGWADINNEFLVKPGEPSAAKFELSLRNHSDKPIEAQIPDGKWVQRRELKVRELKITLDPATDAKLISIVVPPRATVRVPFADNTIDLTGLDPGYWSVSLKSPLHDLPYYLAMWLDAEAPAR